MNQLTKAELTLDSREVAEMVEKNHSHLLRDIETYRNYLGESNIGFTDFFIPSEYISSQNKKLTKYDITKKGCEFIAHKLTGQKGTLFTATYINKFHEMESQLLQPKDSYMIEDPIARAKAWIKEEAKRKALEEEVVENRPRVLFAAAVEDSEDVILVKEMALILTQNGFSIGQNQLFEYLRENEFLCKKPGDMYHLPTRKYEHYFKVIKRNIQSSKGIEVKNTPKINGKGQMYFINRFERYKEQGMTVEDLLNRTA